MSDIEDLKQLAQHYKDTGQRDKYAQALYKMEEVSNSQPQSDERSLAGQAVGGAEAALTIGSGIIAEPIAGLAGIAQSVNPFADNGAGAQAVEDTRSALTYQPRSQAGKENIQDIGEALQPVAEALDAPSQYLGNAVLEKTGSPELAAIAHTLPVAVLELLGFKGAGALKKTKMETPSQATAKEVDAALIDSSPDIKDLKAKSREIYKEIDEAGATVDQDKFLDLVMDIEKTAKKMGYDKDVTPKVSGVLRRVNEELDNVQKVSDIDTLRKVAQGAAGSDLPAEAAIGGAIIQNIDDFFDGLKPSDLKGENISGVGKKYKDARALWGQGRKSEMIKEAFDKADNQASGLENGLRVQFRNILNNKKKRKLLTSEEVAEMNKVIQGTKGANAAKFLGKFGISENQATSMLGASVGVGGGAALGSAVAGSGGAGIGAILVPAIGQVSKKLAQRLTNNNAKMADAIVRSGKKGRDIAKAYMQNTPKELRSPTELKELLLAREVPKKILIEMTDNKNELLAKAAFAALSGARLEETEQ